MIVNKNEFVWNINLIDLIIELDLRNDLFSVNV